MSSGTAGGATAGAGADEGGTAGADVVVEPDGAGGDADCALAMAAEASSVAQTQTVFRRTG
ncbi:MAG TPA: hypothetical protein VER96_13990 [Polyangiaceae bacterium]|nr:hypothetical protein [Polyangiaceae bacterium]